MFQVSHLVFSYDQLFYDMLHKLNHGQKVLFCQGLSCCKQTYLISSLAQQQCSLINLYYGLIRITQLIRSVSHSLQQSRVIPFNIITLQEATLHTLHFILFTSYSLLLLCRFKFEIFI